MTRMKRCLPTVRIHQSPATNACSRIAVKTLSSSKHSAGTRSLLRRSQRTSYEPYPGALRAYLWANEPNGFRPAQVNWNGTCQSTHRLEQSRLQYGSLCIPAKRKKLPVKVTRKPKQFSDLFQNFDSTSNTNQNKLVFRGTLSAKIRHHLIEIHK